MNIEKKDFLFPLSMKTIFLYYLGYCILFLIFHLAAISLVSFFHFLLEHDMAVIENWLYRYAWEIIIISKTLAAFVIIKALKLNNYFNRNLISIFSEDDWKPTRSLIVLIFFLLILFYALIVQFGGELINNNKETNFAYISYLGSVLFYLIDFMILNILVRKLIIKKRTDFLLLTLILLAMFLLITKATLPYINKYLFFLVIHFLSLFSILFKQRKNIINPLLYSLAVIGPFSSIYGLDIVWENAHSFYSYEQEIPVVGISGIWLIGLGYYYKR